MRDKRANSLSRMPHRERYLFVCTNRRDPENPKGSCAQSGSEEVVKKLKEALKTRGLANRLRACATGCLDLCEVGVTVLQEPDHAVYGRVTVADVEEIAEAAGKGEVVQRLLVPAPAPASEAGLAFASEKGAE
jgi:(2Fe-2S) ferredoxin